MKQEPWALFSILNDIFTIWLPKDFSADFNFFSKGFILITELAEVTEENFCSIFNLISIVTIAIFFFHIFWEQLLSFLHFSSFYIV